MTSVTDMLRLFFPIRALEEDEAGLRIEKPNVPKTLRDTLRLVADWSVLGVGGTDGVDGMSSVGSGLLAIEGDAFSDSGESSVRKDTWEVLLLLRGFIHHEPIQSPSEGLSPFCAFSPTTGESTLGAAGRWSMVSTLSTSTLGRVSAALVETTGDVGTACAVTMVVDSCGCGGTVRVAAMGVISSLGTLREIGTSSSMASVSDSARDWSP